MDSPESLAEISILDIYASMTPLLLPFSLWLLWRFIPLQANVIKKPKGIELVVKLGAFICAAYIMTQILMLWFISNKVNNGEIETQSGIVNYVYETNSGVDFKVDEQYFIVSDTDSFCLRTLDNLKVGQEVQLEYIKIRFFPIIRKCIVRLQYINKNGP